MNNEVCRKNNELLGMLGLRDVKVSNDVILYDTGRVLCGRKILIVEGLAGSVVEAGSDEVVHFLRAYFNTLNLGFPIEVRTYVTPVDRDSYLRELDKKIENIVLVLETNPSNTKLRTELEKLKKLRDKVLRTGLSPFDAVAFFAVEACAENEKEVLKTLDSRAKILMNSLEALGIRVRDLRGLRRRIILKLFFRPCDRRGSNLIKRLLAAVSTPKIRVVGFKGAVLHPFIINAKVRLTLRSSGILLGTNLITKEKVYWNLERSLSPHVLVVGPTGSGKTEFLATLVKRLKDVYGIQAIVLDVKGEYSERLSRRGLKISVARLGDNAGLGLREIAIRLPRESRVGIITELFVNAFMLSSEREVVSSLYHALDSVLSDYSVREEWLREVMDYVTTFEDGYLCYKVGTILNYIAPFDDGEPLLNMLASLSDDVLVIDLSYAVSVSSALASLTAGAIIKSLEFTILSPSRLRNSLVPRIALIFDEGWIYLRRNDLVTNLVRLGRGYGALVALATQDIGDVIELSRGLLDNIGLFMVLASPDRSYWSRLSEVLRIRRIIEQYSLLLGRGEGVVRISPDPRPLPLKLILD
ncbi:MAG: ATP-binding protein [Desulfurococcales archaeon]|nr:ATP-binding protein [Desulfurococcales archaeon]